MKKLLILSVLVLLVVALALPALAAGSGPVITLQPQSPTYPEYAVAMYTVKASGTNLHAYWYMEWQGKTYEISAIGGAMQPWEPFAGETYGARQPDANTFTYMFQGISYDLDGAYIWCTIEDGHYSVTSQKVRVSVGNEHMPPEILNIPAALTVPKGGEAEIRCVAKSPDGSQLSFLWYETPTGKLQDISAVNRGAETTDYMLCDTSVVGTRNYLCKVETANGGIAYSSYVSVTVVEPTEAPKITTNTLPTATAGQPYSTKISASGDKAVFEVYYNPGKANDLDKTGLTIASDGTLSGTPKAAGSYTFCICASNAGGEDYKVYTLTVSEAVPETTGATEPEETTAPTTAPTKPSQSAPKDSGVERSRSDSVPGWALVLMGLLATAIGVGVAVLLTKKQK